MSKTYLSNIVSKCNSVHTFPPIILTSRGDNFVFQHWGCYINLTQIVLSLKIPEKYCCLENMIKCEDTSQQQLHFLQSCGFGGLWRFAGPFTKSNCNAENVDLFMNCLEALVETWLPRDENDQELPQYPSMLSGNYNQRKRGQWAVYYYTSPQGFILTFSYLLA